tara:strand:+ start:229 stop:345 length:117 start_codon:yes stop_codon:yes gene_type:complete
MHSFQSQQTSIEKKKLNPQKTQILNTHSIRKEMFNFFH